MKIRHRIILVTGVMLLGLVVLAFFVAIPTIESSIEDQTKLKLKNMTEAANSITEYYYKEYQAGRLSGDDARVMALETIRNMRYNESDYIWIHDLDNYMIMHPIVSDLEGQDQTNLTDANGSQIIVDMNKIIREDSEGYYGYMWPKPGEEEPQAKRSYVKLFKPWGWVFGTGIYIDDLQALISSFRTKIYIVSLVIIALAGGVILFTIPSMIRSLKYIIEHTDRYAELDFTEPMEVKGTDELSDIARAFNSVISNVKQLTGSISDTVETVEHNAERLNDISGELKQISSSTSSGSVELSDSMAQTTESAESINEMIDRIKESIGSISAKVSEGAETTNSVSDRAVELKHDAQSASDKAGTIYHEVKEKLETALEQSKAVSEIDDLAASILDITEQTNLLALNASIEAARAGEAGRGFAVVADEIGKLALQSSETVNAIQNIVRVVTESVNRLKESSIAMLEFIDQEVLSDYEKLNDVSDQYSDDSESFNGIMIDLNQETTALKASIDSIVHMMNDVAEAMEQGLEQVKSIDKFIGDMQDMSTELGEINQDNRSHVSELMRTVQTIKD